jgi:ATP-grasp domain/L-amino acid ligase C-terminal domain 2/ATP-grasp N-terminal domain
VSRARNVLLCATTTGYQIRSFGEAAERLGVRLTFASDRCDQLRDPWGDAALPVRFDLEDAAVLTVARAFAGCPPAGVLAVGDRPVVVAARVARAFGLPGHPPEAAAVSRNKLETRRALAAAGLPVPWFRSVDLDLDVADIARLVKYPAVIKPLELSGSCGVIRVDAEAELAAAVARLRRLFRTPEMVGSPGPARRLAIVESFIPGAEFALEGLLVEGEMMVLALFDKPDPLDGPYFEETVYVTPSRLEHRVQRTIAEQVGAAARAIGLHHGPVHAECRVNASGVYVLEVAARPIGGLCSKAVRLQDARGASASLEDVLIRHAIGEDVRGYRQESMASGVMMIPIPRQGVYRETLGVDAALAVDGVEEVRMTAKPDTLLVPLPEGRSYLGFIFAGGDEPAGVERALREAHGRLRFRIDRELPVS